MWEGGFSALRNPDYFSETLKTEQESETLGFETFLIGSCELRGSGDQLGVSFQSA